MAAAKDTTSVTDKNEGVDKGTDGSKSTTGRASPPQNTAGAVNKTPPAATGNTAPSQGGTEMVADNKTVTADVAGNPPGVDPQAALNVPTSTDPSNQMPGGIGYATRDVPEGSPLHDMSAQEKVKMYCETFVDSSPDSRIVFGSVAVSITMGDLRELAGLK